MRLVADRLGHRGDAVAMGPSGPVFRARFHARRNQRLAISGLTMVKCLIPLKFYVGT